MGKSGITAKIRTGHIVALAILSGLYLVTFSNYLLFHTLAELFSIVIAGAIFALIWAAKDNLDFKALLFLGIAYLFIGFIDLMHTLNYTGIEIIAGSGNNMTTQLWTGGRYIQALTLLAFPFIINRYSKYRLQFLIYAAVTAGLFLSIFYFENFPTTFIEDRGLTPFKVISEYIISALLICALVFMWKKKKLIPQRVLKLLSISVVLTIASELAFTLYTDPYGTANIIGHYFKIGAFYFIYKAVVETGIHRPEEILFYKLNKARRQFKEQYDRLFNILENMQTGVYIISKQGEVEYVNPALKRDFGDPEGKRCYEYCFNRDTPCPDCKNREVFDGKEVRWEKKYPNGKSYELRESLLINPDGSKSKLKIFTDITEFKKAREEAEKKTEQKDKALKRAEEKTKKKDKELKEVHVQMEHIRRLSDIGKLAAIVAHELRNPLATMKVSLFNLSQKIDREDQLKHIKRIKGRITESDQIIDNLLFYSKIKKPQFKEINPEELVNESIQEVKESFSDKEIEIVKKINLAKNTDFKGDFYQLKEVLNNLLANAVQAAGEKGGRIDLELFTEENSIVIVVKDNGPGIDKEIIDKVTDPFFTTRSSGTGLGLAICAQIAHFHNASLSIDSSPGKG
ncbi:MAG: MASE3 domain-containing protein, partial [Elusimicrobiota bacterium]